MFKTIPHGRSQVFAMLDTTLRLLYPPAERGGGWCLVPVYLPAIMQSSVARRQPDPIMSDVWWLMSVSTQTTLRYDLHYFYLIMFEPLKSTL